MSEPKYFIERLRRPNCGLKAPVLFACSILVLVALAGFVAISVLGIHDARLSLGSGS
jgi:hypothetical protein